MERASYSSPYEASASMSVKSSTQASPIISWTTPASMWDMVGSPMLMTLKDSSPSKNNNLYLTYVSQFSQKWHQKKYTHTTYSILLTLRIEQNIFQPPNVRRKNMKRARQADNWEMKMQRKELVVQYGDKVTRIYYCCCCCYWHTYLLSWTYLGSFIVIIIGFRLWGATGKIGLLYTSGESSWVREAEDGK